MLDLENLKIVAFCFDDTLFAHSKHKTESGNRKENQYNGKTRKNQKRTESGSSTNI